MIAAAIFAVLRLIGRAVERDVTRFANDTHEGRRDDD